MGKLITAKIDVTKIDKSRLFKGEKGTYLDLTIWQNDKPDQYGNDFSIEQRTAKGEDKIYIGNGKFFQKKTETPPESNGEWQKGEKRNVPSMSDPDDLGF
jgi:hypothetical protein